MIIKGHVYIQETITTVRIHYLNMEYIAVLIIRAILLQHRPDNPRLYLHDIASTPCRQGVNRIPNTIPQIKNTIYCHRVIKTSRIILLRGNSFHHKTWWSAYLTNQNNLTLTHIESYEAVADDYTVQVSCSVFSIVDNNALLFYLFIVLVRG